MRTFLDTIEVVLLDIDGTVLDFDACVVETMREGFCQFGLPEYEPWMFEYFKEINDILWKQLERGEITQQELFAVRWKRILERIGIAFDGSQMEQFFRQKLLNSAIPVPGAGKLLETLACRYELGVASNGPYEQQRRRLTLAGFADHFTYFFVSQRIGCAKPDPRFFKTAMNEMNEGRLRCGKPQVKPGEVLMVGDSLTSDMDGGIGFGMKTCYLDHKEAGPDGRPVDLIVHSLGELADIVTGGDSGNA
ncbi:MAG: HAD-IA family hydrolase [Clostridia bacterium]|nr:HAD-IA family hydrolase [Clostridia bacterium]